MSSEARLAKAPSMKLVRLGPFIFIGLLVLATAVGPGIAAGDAAAGKMLYLSLIHILTLPTTERV